MLSMLSACTTAAPPSLSRLVHSSSACVSGALKLTRWSEGGGYTPHPSLSAPFHVTTLPPCEVVVEIHARHETIGVDGAALCRSVSTPRPFWIRTYAPTWSDAMEGASRVGVGRTSGSDLVATTHSAYFVPSASASSCDLKTGGVS